MNVAGAPDGGNEFDFWIGEWDVEWETDGEPGRGVNRVSRILDQQVILEEFDGRPGTPLLGLSVTTQDPVAGWVQTWVDSQANHWHFAGGFDEGRMILRTSGFQNERPVELRMVWDDIRSDGLTWQWERSLDGGRSWETLWRLEYRRRRHPGPSVERPPHDRSPREGPPDPLHESGRPLTIPHQDPALRRTELGLSPHANPPAGSAH